MPKDGGIAARYSEAAIQEADAFLTKDCDAIRLSSEQVHSFSGRSLQAGWQVAVDTGASTRRLDICVDPLFPFSLPHFFLLDRPNFLTWPHIEEDGRLCLLDEGVVTDFRRPAEVIGELLGDAFRLICESESGANENDFRTEFYSYWNRSLPAETPKIKNLLRLNGRSRLVQIWRGKTHSVVGETEEQVLSWLRHRYGAKPDFDTTDTAGLLWLSQPLVPRQYPKKASDVYGLACSVVGGKKLLGELGAASDGPFCIILAAESGSGPCLAAVETRKPPPSGARGKKRDNTRDGFRPGKIPASELAQRLFRSSTPINRMVVERIDAAWIHGRDQDPRQATLFAKSVIVIGCGSVGGPLAEQLAMAGVGRLTLVDPQELAWSNIGRHPLGAESVGLNKATALATRLQRNYPHLVIEGFDSGYRTFALDQSRLLSRADLIISATADWRMESQLNLEHVHGEVLQPVLYVWTEPHACAGHAVLIHSGGPCLQCGLTATGESRLEVTVWPAENKMSVEPACGAVFQPYGPVELMGINSIGASLALDSLLGKATKATHRIWAGPYALLAEAGGQWSEQWLNGDNRGKGGFQEEWPWERDSLCLACGGGTETSSSTPLENPGSCSY